MTEIKAVILDFHDTIAHLDPSFAEILASESGVPVEMAASAVSTLEPQVDQLRRSELWLAGEAGIGWDWWYGEFCNLSSCDVAPHDLYRCVSARLADPQSYVTWPDVDRDLAHLQRLRITLGCVSNTVLDLARALQHLELDQYFDYLANSEDLHASKPSRVFFERISAQLGLHMSEILFVGDKAEEDAAGAARSGMAGVWLARGLKNARIPDSGYFVIPDLSSISGLISAMATPPLPDAD